MRSKFPELCVFCHHQKYVLSLQNVMRGLSGGLVFKCTCCYFDSSLKIWMVIWDIFHVNVKLPHCFRIETPLRFYCNMSFSSIIVFCFPMIFFYFFIILLLVFFYYLCQLQFFVVLKFISCLHCFSLQYQKF